MEQKELNTKAKKMPLKNFKSGSYAVSLWENTHKKDNKEFTVVSASLQKSWKKSNSSEFERATISGIAINDIPKIMMLLRKAYEEESMRVE